MGRPGQITGTYGRLDAQVSALAVRQHAVFSLAQLMALGLGASTVHKRVASARLHRIHRAVYSLVPRELLTRNGRFMAAVLACGEGAVLSHRSAAWLHDLRPTARADIEVTVPGRSTRRQDGIEVHRSTTLTAADITTVDAIPCTTVAWTLFDLAGVLPLRPVERACEQAEHLEVLDLGALREQARNNPNRRGAAVIRDVLAGYDVGAGPTESELEEAFLGLLIAAGLPPAERQHYLDAGDGEPMIRLDFAWRRQRLAVEVDGARYHRSRARFEADRRRDYRQLRDEPRRIVALVAGLLGVRPA
jgi:hypothetical protein